MDLEDIRQFCLSLPGTTEDIKWEDHLCFNIGGKMYVITSLSGETTMTVKVADEDFDALVTKPGISKAPYIGRYKWILLEDYTVIDTKQLKSFMRQSYDLIKSKLPKKIIRQWE